MAGDTTKRDVAAATPEKPITVAERKKAEELIRAEFSNLEAAVRNEVTDKLDVLKAAWQKSAGVDKLLAKIEKKEAEIEALRKQLRKLTADEYYDRGYNPGMTGRFAQAKKRLETAKRQTIEHLAVQRVETLKQLWFGILSKDAMRLVESVPSVTDLKKNGLAVLGMSLPKLLKS